MRNEGKGLDLVAESPRLIPPGSWPPPPPPPAAFDNLRACLHGGGGPQVGEVTRFGG